ncbi:MAG: hypothetical protein ABJC13_06185 [Acidobacteriota bacterium]
MNFRRSILAVLGVAFLFLAASIPARALVPYRVADIDPTFRSVGSDPNRFVRVGARSLFVATTPGVGLWSSDGTAPGTVRLVRNQVSIEHLVATGDLAFFIACDPTLCRLYSADGTVGGTRAIASPFVSASPAAVAAGPRRIYFARQTPALGSELWTSDGTLAGTRLVKDLASGPGGSTPSRLVWFRGRLWFFALDGLWTSDGTASGTRRIATVGSAFQASSAGSRLLFFAAAAGSPQARLWSSDGTAAGTRVLAGVAPVESATVRPFGSTATEAFFFISREDPADARQELWASDGTPARTRKLARFEAGNAATPFLVVGSRVGFLAYDSEHGRELWASDGKPGGTRSLDICPGNCDGVERLGVSDGLRIWFAGDDGVHRSEPWISDLTPAGTRLIKDIVPLSTSNPEGFIAEGGKAYFIASGLAEEALWTSDGTAAGTFRIVRPAEDVFFSLGLGTIVGGRVFFRMDDSVHGAEPWVSDGTAAGSALVADLDPSQDGGSAPHQLSAGGARCFFFANAKFGERETELWSSDGTAAGTAFLERFEFGFELIAQADLGSRVALVEGRGGVEIWLSDGTADGTFIAHGNDVYPTGRIRAVGSRLFFEASDSDHGDELWTTDGTPAGTLRLTDFTNPEPFTDTFNFQRAAFRVLGDRLVFLAADAFGRFEPWISDGTIGGTRHLGEVYPAIAAPLAELSSEIVPVGNRYFFVSGEETTVDPGLWVTDLTAAGTKRIGDLRDPQGRWVAEAGLFALGSRAILFYQGQFDDVGFVTSDGTTLTPGAGVGLPFGVTPVLWGSRLVFRAEDGLYATDGTPSGTVQLHGANGQEIRATAYALIGGRLAYLAADGIWETNGTPAGTKRLLAPREGQTLDFVRAGDRIFFPWYDKATGVELWALRP